VLDEIQLAAERTYLAHERTLMAWVRTGASLITFGFGFYQFFEFMHQEEPSIPVSRFLGPRTFGVAFIIIGVGFLGTATVQHWQSMKRLRAQQFAATFSLTLLLAMLMTLIGILALLTLFIPE
jgi:putative membrane protein